jgi:DNA polymerase IV
MSERTIMHIDLDAFFVSVEQASNPDLRGKPVVVGGKLGSRGVVATASYEARSFGLHSAMPLSTAVRLCPQAIFIEGNYQNYSEVSKKFMAILADFSPFLEPMGLDEAYMDVTGFESLHGSIHEMALKIKQRIKNELGIIASIGIASCKVVAKVASDEYKPDGLVEVPAGQEASFLAPLAIRKLPGVGKKTEQVLVNQGIRTIGQLARIPSTSLKSRFGLFGDALHRHANGIDNSLVTPPEESKSISRETTFEEDTHDKIFLMATMRYLSEKAGADMRRLGKQTKCISIKVRYADFTTISRQKALPQLTDLDETIFRTGNELLQKAIMNERLAVRLIGVGVSNLREPGGQLMLINDAEQRLMKLNRAVDRIRDKYGFTSIRQEEPFNSNSSHTSLMTFIMV